MAVYKYAPVAQVWCFIGDVVCTTFFSTRYPCCCVLLCCCWASPTAAVVVFFEGSSPPTVRRLVLLREGKRYSSPLVGASPGLGDVRKRFTRQHFPPVQMGAVHA